MSLVLNYYKDTSPKFLKIKKIYNLAENKSKESNLKIAFCSDRNSWINIFISELIIELTIQGNICLWVNSHKDITPSDICFYLSYEKIVDKETLNINKYNLVIHESNLPSGKGWSPLTWQIIEGKNKFPITLFEARENVDSGDIYSQSLLEFDGSELCDELRNKQGLETQGLIFEFIRNLKNDKLVRKKQLGKESFYRKRNAQDMRLIQEPRKSIQSMRTADSKKYPSFFTLNGTSYKVIIEKQKIIMLKVLFTGAGGAGYEAFGRLLNKKYDLHF